MYSYGLHIYGLTREQGATRHRLPCAPDCTRDDFAQHATPRANATPCDIALHAMARCGLCGHRAIDGLSKSQRAEISRENGRKSRNAQDCGSVRSSLLATRLLSQEDFGRKKTCC